MCTDTLLPGANRLMRVSISRSSTRYFGSSNKRVTCHGFSSSLPNFTAWGSVKALFGKANTWHTHVRPWVDQPLVIHNFFGDEQLNGSGISVSKIFPNSFNTFVEGTAEIYNGNNSVFFRGDQSTGRVHPWVRTQSAQVDYSLMLANNMPALAEVPALFGDNPLVDKKSQLKYVP